MASQDKNDQDQHSNAPRIGSLLKASRLRLGDDLRDVADILKIRHVYLEAIEDGRFDELPGATYATGFIRAYADHLGLDSEEVVRRYKGEKATAVASINLEFPEPIPEQGIPGGAIIFIGTLVAAVAYGVWYMSTSKDGLLVEMISPLPDRLAKLSADQAPDQKKTPEAKEEAPQEKVKEEVKEEAPTQEVKEEAPQSAPDTTQRVEAPAEPTPEAAPEPAPEAASEAAPEPAPEPASQPAAESETVSQPVAPAETEAASTVTPEPVTPPAPATPAAPVEAPSNIPMDMVPPPKKIEHPDPVASPEPVPAAPIVAARKPTPEPTPEPKPEPALKSPAEPVVEPAPQPEPPPTPAPETISTPTPAPAPAPETASLPPASDAGGDKIVVRALTNSWIQVRDDNAGELLMTRLLRAGDTYAVPDRSGLKLSTGNAGALEILVNGKAVPSIGGDGVVRRDVALDAEKLKSGKATGE